MIHILTLIIQARETTQFFLERISKDHLLHLNPHINQPKDNPSKFQHSLNKSFLNKTFQMNLFNNTNNLNFHISILRPHINKLSYFRASIIPLTISIKLKSLSNLNHFNLLSPSSMTNLTNSNNLFFLRINLLLSWKDK